MPDHEPRFIAGLGGDDFTLESRIRVTLHPQSAPVPDEGYPVWDDFQAGKTERDYRSKGTLYRHDGEGFVFLRIRTVGPQSEFKSVRQSHIMHAEACKAIFSAFEGPAEFLPD